MATTAAAPPSAFKVHGALIATQVIFGAGSVVGKLGVATFNPMLFALIREVAAGVLLLIAARLVDGPQRLRSTRDLGLFVAAGFFIFTNQAFFIVGDKLAGPVLASAWQPTQPVIALLISLCLGWEKLTLGKTLGIAVSVAGATFMVSYGADFSGAAATIIAGNALFFFNCLGTALYVITAKFALARGYPPSTVTAWSYLFGAVLMLCVASGMNTSCEMVSLLCPPHPTASHTCGSHATSCAPWAVPPSAVLPLLYWILFNSCAAYWLMTWANKHAQAGFVLAYCALQPLTSTALSAAIAGSGAHTNIAMPGWNALGAIPVILGLVLIVRDGKRAHERQGKDEPLSGTAARVSSANPNRDPLLE